jgi:hypothetical protein
MVKTLALQIINQCEHELHFEAIILDEDRRMVTEKEEKPKQKTVESTAAH